MMRIYLLTVAVLVLVSTASAEDRSAEQVEFFEREIRPVLVKECYSCHSTQAKSVKAGLLLDTREGIRRGGDSGHAVVPGNLDESLLIEAVRYEGLEMPPKKQLPERVVANLEKWIRMGAPDPRDGKSAPVRQKIDFATAREFWSFRPVGKSPVPKSPDDQWSVTDIDRYVFAKLEAAGLSPAQDAQPASLIRRLYFDLIGLPPTPDQIEEYVSDPKPQRFAEITDRLLSSDQFGERWGRHWMDVVRYAESTGMERNYTYPEAWRYRDYVIQSFNMDKPFDRFLTEQIAGDQLPFDHKHQRDTNLTATGMLAIGPKSLNERNREKFAMDIVDEQIDVVSRAFLGLTASCARCHDHKFDPIPQAEYYGLAGIFRSTDTFYGTGGGGGNRQGGRLLALHDSEVVPVSVRAGNGKSTKNNVKKLEAQLKSQRARLKRLKPNTPAAQKQKLQKAIRRIEDQLKAARNKVTRPQPADAMLVMAVQDGAKPADTEVRIRGEADERGEVVPRGFLTIATLTEAPLVKKDDSGRQALAAWLTQPENPLTARVAANRVWQHLFGQGIVRTVNNFGANGDRPSHPELLDYLALQLRDNGWSVKAMIRSIVASRSYRQAATPNRLALQKDPENRLLWRMNPRRLEAEAIRDAILAVSGTLDLSPAEQSIVRSVGNGDVGRNLRPEQFSTGNTKRSVYLPIVRGVVPEMLRVFDFPEPSIIAGARDVTTVPTQALYMMNSPFVVKQSQEMAERILTAREDNRARVIYGYQLAVGRPATDAEIKRSLSFVTDAEASASDNSADSETTSKKAWAGFCQVLLASAEFRYLE